MLKGPCSAPKEEGQTIGQKLSGFADYVASQAPLPQVLGQAYGYALPFAEVAAGFLLIVGFLARPAAGVISLMLLSFLFALGFGAEQGPFSKEVILLTLALLLMVTGPGGISVDSLFGKGGKSQS